MKLIDDGLSVTNANHNGQEQVMKLGAFSSSRAVKDLEASRFMAVDPDGNPILVDQHV